MNLFKKMNSCSEFRIQEFRAIKDEITKRVGYQIQVLVFFYNVSAFLFSYAIIYRLDLLMLFIPILLSFGEINIAYHRFALIALGKYIRENIEPHYTQGCKIIGWEHYLIDLLDKYKGIYSIIIFMEFSLFSVFFWYGVYKGIYCVSSFILVFYFTLYLMVFWYYIKILNFRRERN